MSCLLWMYAHCCLGSSNYNKQTAARPRSDSHTRGRTTRRAAVGGAADATGAGAHTVRVCWNAARVCRTRGERRGRALGVRARRLFARPGRKSTENSEKAEIVAL